jgi:hypothetical protein
VTFGEAIREQGLSTKAILVELRDKESFAIPRQTKRRSSLKDPNCSTLGGLEQP